MPDTDQNLPAVPDDGAVEEMIFDGEFAGDEPQPVPAARQKNRNISVVLHPQTRRLLIHAAYIWAGIMLAVRRWHESRTRHERMMRAAEMSGDHETMLKWAQHQELSRKQRSDRRQGWAETALNAARLLPFIAAGLLGIPLILGLLIAIAMHSLRGFAVPWLLAARAAFTVYEIMPWLLGFTAAAVPAVIVARLHYLGRTGGGGPGWVVTSADDSDVTIDETTVARALYALRIPQITDYIKGGLPLQFLTPCRVDGRGTHFVARLPDGVTAEKIARRRADVAASLHRLTKETWLTTGVEAGLLDGWIADKGALAEGAGPYPLLEGGFTDVFKGLPLGKTLRGDPARIPVTGRNTLCGGMPEQGKSTAARDVAAGYTLDITTELRIYIPDTNFDFEAFRPRCSRYVMGAEDEFVEEILGDLEDLKDELQARGQLLVDYEQPEVTRELARAGVGLHPVFWLLEEAHMAIQHRKFGKDITRLLCENVKLDRKRGVHMMLSTQSPVRGSMPPDVTRNCTNGIAFAVGDYYANDALLGAGAYAGGHRATELIPGTDRGTALCKGFSGQRSDIVQVHFLSVARENDQVTPLVERSLAEMTRRGRALPGAGIMRAIEARDLLADLGDVLGEGRVRLADVPPLLRKLAPSWGLYRSLTGEQLKSLLGGEGVRWTNAGNVPRLDPADVRAALTRRGE